MKKRQNGGVVVGGGVVFGVSGVVGGVAWRDGCGCGEVVAGGGCRRGGHGDLVRAAAISRTAMTRLAGCVTRARLKAGPFARAVHPGQLHWSSSLDRRSPNDGRGQTAAMPSGVVATRRRAGGAPHGSYGL
jgi:hypothetical protein